MLILNVQFLLFVIYYIIFFARSNSICLFLMYILSFYTSVVMWTGKGAQKISFFCRIIVDNNNNNVS